MRFLRSIFVPEDDVCLYLYQATTAAAVREAAERAGVAFNCIYVAHEGSIS